MIKLCLLLSLLLFATNSAQNIAFFGAKANLDTLEAQIKKTKALNEAITKANMPESVGDARIVVIPKGKYYFLPIYIANVHWINI